MCLFPVKYKAPSSVESQGSVVGQRAFRKHEVGIPRQGVRDLVRGKQNDDNCNNNKNNQYLLVSCSGPALVLGDSVFQPSQHLYTSSCSTDKKVSGESQDPSGVCPPQAQARFSVCPVNDIGSVCVALRARSLGWNLNDCSSEKGRRAD